MCTPLLPCRFNENVISIIPAKDRQHRNLIRCDTCWPLLDSLSSLWFFFFLYHCFCLPLRHQRFQYSILTIIHLFLHILINKHNLVHGLAWGSICSFSVAYWISKKEFGKSRDQTRNTANPGEILVYRDTESRKDTVLCLLSQYSREQRRAERGSWVFFPLVTWKMVKNLLLLQLLTIKGEDDTAKVHSSGLGY